MRFRVNLDFDSALSFNDPKYINDKYVKELEYIFFLLNKSAKNTLVSKYDYSFDYLSHLENLGFKVSIVYGRLSPEVRREQARKFDQGETDIMVSTDAIAMGMNLPVKFIRLDNKERTIIIELE